MGSTPKRPTAALLVLSLIAIADIAAAGSTPTFQVEGRTYGLPEARIFDDPYEGPPVVGEFLTLAPQIAALPPGKRTHSVRVDVVAREVWVAPDMRYQAWTFGGSVPGPVLHVREGDRIQFTMKNRSHEAVAITAPSPGGSPYLDQLVTIDPQRATSIEAPMRHSMDFHSGTVAASDKWRGIDPGQAIQFDWIANYPGVYLYHCGTPPILQHLSQGQYGVVIVSPKEGYPTDSWVNREYVIVQSEFYLRPSESSGVPADQTGIEGENGTHYELDFDAAQRKDAKVVAFNGHSRSLVDRPLQAAPGERVRFYVLNVGPSGTSSFHVVGAIFDRVWYEGNLKNEWHGMQTVLLGASNGMVAEFVVPEAGSYVIVDHEFADAQKGAIGLLKAEAMTTDPAGGH
jgi:nitrite reductase (NO-forming)